MSQVSTPVRGESAHLSGAMIAVFAIGSLIALSRHPVADRLHSIAQLAAQDRQVHGVIIALLVGLLLALATLTQRLGWERAAPRSAFLVFALGAGAGIGAMLIDGFLIADAGERFANASAEQAAIVDVALSIAASAIQVLTKTYLILGSLGIALWSIALWRLGGLARASALLGALVSFGAAAAMLLTSTRLNPHSLIMLMGPQSLWFLTIAGLIFARRI